MIRRLDGSRPIALSGDGKTLGMMTGALGKPRFELCTVAAFRDDRLQQALAPALQLGAVVRPDGDGIRVELELPGGPDSIAAMAALVELPVLRSLILTKAEMIPDAAVLSLSKCKSLRSLTINNSDLRDDHLKEIASLSNLVALDLSSCQKLTVPGLAVLAKLSRLEELRLNGIRIDRAGLQPLVELTKLRSLSLRSTYVNDEGLDVLAKFPLLTELDLGPDISDLGLAKLKSSKHLRVLLLGGCDVGDAGLAHLSELTALEKLDLSATQVTDTGLAHLKPLTNLKHLDLSGTRITDAGFAHFSGMTSLRSIGLNYLEKVTGTGLQHLRGAKGLTELNLYTSGATDAGLAGLKDWVQLRSLLLPDRITDAGLLHLNKLTNLQSVNLSDLRKVTGPGFAGLKNATAIKSLDLSNHPVTDTGVDGLKEWKHLEELTLPKNITDAGLAPLMGLKALTALRVRGAAISDAGLAHLRGLTNLELLDLDGTKISDAGLPIIEGLQNLRKLSIGSTKVTDAGIEKLQKKLPNSEINRY